MLGTPSKPPTAAPAPEYSYSFKIVHLLYVVALFASAFAVLGLFGILPGAVVALFWAAVYAKSSGAKAVLGTSVAVLALACLLWPSFSRAGPKAERMKCSNNLRQIALALHTYRDAWGEFPPAYIPDKEGRPMHSWRVLILPFAEEFELYQEYDFNEPWDGPNNSKLLTKMPRDYTCPSHYGMSPESNQCTSYVAVVEGDASRPLGGGNAGNGNGRAGNRIVLVEVNKPEIPWTQPTDWNLDEALEHVLSDDVEDRAPHRQERPFFQYAGGRNAALADASVQHYLDTMSREEWIHALTVEGRTAATDPDGTAKSAPIRGVKLSDWLATGSFLVLSILPLPWVFRKRAAVTSPKQPPGAEPSA